MRKIILSLHVTLDGFVAGPNGEMDWIKLDQEMFDLVGRFTDSADIAMYGRITWEMMQNYWPDAGTQANASKHDKEHSFWYNHVNKIVLSRTMKGKMVEKTKFINENIEEEVKSLKNEEGKNILIFGSPSAAHTLMQYNLIDEYWLFINPVLLGKGIPVFKNIMTKTGLTALSTIHFKCGVTGLHFSVDRK